MKLTRESILKDVADAVLKNRQATYSPSENSFNAIAALWNNYLHARLTPGPNEVMSAYALESHDVAAMMILLKVARIAIDPTHTDSWTDTAGYAVCGGELAPSAENLQPCNTCESELQAESTRPLTDEEQIMASQMGHTLLSQTLQSTMVTNGFETALAMDAVLRPSTLTLSQLLRLSNIINRK